jgi:hypothetical protein
MMMRKSPIVLTIVGTMILGACSTSDPGPGDTTRAATQPTTQAADKSSRDPWIRFGFGSGALEFETFDSLESMVRSADVTLLGTVEPGQFGKRYVDSAPGEKPMVDVDMVLKIRVDAVLAGEVFDGSTTIKLVMGPYDTEEISQTPWKPLIGSQAIFSLRRTGARVVSQWGTAPADPEALATHTYHVVYSGGLLNEAADETTRAPWAEKFGWIRQVVRRPFKDVLASIRAADD